jgi:hypothetical protein
MMTGLLVAGIGVLVAGLLAIGFGIQDKEFEVGKTLILAGATVACTGLMTLGLWVVVRELRNIAKRLAPANQAAAARPKTGPQSSVAAPGDAAADSGLLKRDRPAVENPDRAEPSPSAVSSASRQDETAERDRARSSGDVTSEPAPEPAAATKPRRNLLFSSSSRKERERATARTAAPAAVTPDPAAAPVPPAAVPVANETPPATFEDAWPQSERARSDAALWRSRTPSTSTEPNPAAAITPDRLPPAALSEETPAVTVLKSGVVDGMAYSLYSDGSIEAQMPEGMMRFASIDELRSHLDQRP